MRLKDISVCSLKLDCISPCLQDTQRWGEQPDFFIWGVHTSMLSQ